MLRQRLRRVLSLENLESRTLLAGDIVFAEPVVYPAGGAPAWVTSGDVNLDGVLDLVVPNYGCCGGQNTMLLGNGDGTFGAPIPVDRAGQLADFDNDGELDMIVPGGRSEKVRVMLNEGIDTQVNQWKGFGSPHEFLVSGTLLGIIGIEDFDGDSELDIAVGSNRSRIWVLLNQGQSDDGWQGFGEPQEYTAGNFSDQVVAGDLDGDGDVDLVVGNYHGGDVTLLMGNGDGTFEHLDNYAVGNRVAETSVNLGDFDFDGDLDIAAAVFNSNEVAVLLGNGDGTFAERIHYPVSHPTWSMTAADLDRDGDLDLATSSDSRSIDLLINNGDGTFFEREDSLSVVAGKEAGITAADLDGDGDMDLAVAAPFGSGLSCGGCGVNVFLNITEVTMGPQPGDSNLDGVFDQLDIVHVLQAAKYLTGQPATFEEGDWNNDGVFDQLDIIAALATGNYL